MAYDEELADRIHDVVRDEPGLSVKRMFGGLAFLIDGHMAASASRQGGILLRVDPAQTRALVDEPLVGPFVMRGREMDACCASTPTPSTPTTRRGHGWVMR